MPPTRVLEKAGRAATAARANRAPLIAGAALLIAFLLIRRSRGRNR
ncbi:Late embryogenesis abundant protein OS=Streptomyces microflavus OX=1919 GN=Smic_04250 PE=4 SV=1 [Streptomyces microflavus]